MYSKGTKRADINPPKPGRQLHLCVWSFFPPKQRSIFKWSAINKGALGQQKRKKKNILGLLRSWMWVIPQINSSSVVVAPLHPNNDSNFSTSSHTEVMELTWLGISCTCLRTGESTYNFLQDWQRGHRSLLELKCWNNKKKKNDYSFIIITVHTSRKPTWNVLEQRELTSDAVDEELSRFKNRTVGDTKTLLASEQDLKTLSNKKESCYVAWGHLQPEHRPLDENHRSTRSLKEHFNSSQFSELLV